MLQSSFVLQTLADQGVDFYCGVPDSLLKSFCAYVDDQAASSSHVIAANEGNAVALAAGHYLASGRPALVYLQNSGLGNTVNPLVSLADPSVYGIPMILLIGWRGQPGTADEPQHLQQGCITPALLKTLGIPCQVLDCDPQPAARQLEDAVAAARQRSAPAAVLVPAGTFADYKSCRVADTRYRMSREQALQVLLDELPPETWIVCTTGKASRELFELRVQRGDAPGRDFLCVGSMGHASQIALGMALARPDRQVVCLDGDGALLMHLGGLAVIGQQQPANLAHIVLNNEAHESVGGQPTAAGAVDLTALAEGCRLATLPAVDATDDLAAAVRKLLAMRGPRFLEVRVRVGSRADLGRPTTSPLENKKAFMCLANEKGGHPSPESDLVTESSPN